MIVTVSLDTMQFYGQALVLAQKLAYLYGYPYGRNDLFSGYSVNEQTTNKLNRLMGIMMAGAAAKWVGVSATKQTLARGVFKAIPGVGGVVSAGGTAVMMQRMGKRLKKHLRETDFSEDLDMNPNPRLSLA